MFIRWGLLRSWSSGSYVVRDETSALKICIRANFNVKMDADFPPKRRANSILRAITTQKTIICKCNTVNATHTALHLGDAEDLEH
jgi:hypothetical protein